MKENVLVTRDANKWISVTNDTEAAWAINQDTWDS